MAEKAFKGRFYVTKEFLDLKGKEKNAFVRQSFALLPDKVIQAIFAKGLKAEARLDKRQSKPKAPLRPGTKRYYIITAKNRALPIHRKTFSDKLGREMLAFLNKAELEAMVEKGASAPTDAVFPSGPKAKVSQGPSMVDLIKQAKSRGLPTHRRTREGRAVFLKGTELVSMIRGVPWPAGAIDPLAVGQRKSKGQTYEQKKAGLESLGGYFRLKVKGKTPLERAVSTPLPLPRRSARLQQRSQLSSTTASGLLQRGELTEEELAELQRGEFDDE